uniref:Y kinetoplast minicircle sequence, clone M369r, orf n=1 Tax=Trypanosoma cruzi TaxID=5693 RepID=Q99233_TRYCR|nr:orf [Trypanosoma cruzi]AAC13761.1 orf [Trypanosoma cruzi]CAA39652.1 cDNA52 product [Trypanosoma cruzi]
MINNKHQTIPTTHSYTLPLIHYIKTYTTDNKHNHYNSISHYYTNTQLSNSRCTSYPIQLHKFINTYSSILHQPQSNPTSPKIPPNP